MTTQRKKSRESNESSEIKNQKDVFLVFDFTALTSLIAFVVLNPLLAHAVSVPLTVQAASYPGSVDPATLSWSQDPLTMGIPFAQDSGVTNVNQLGVSGASDYQFRLLGSWPNGSVKWALLDTLADGPGSAITVSGGSGKSSGASLATDNGGTITVNTDAAVFTIKKANFNVIDSVVIGAQTLVASSNVQTRGLVITGPTPGQTVCPPCTTIYSSANDPNSQATIEENGPVKAVIRAVGNHMDSSGHPYMQYTARLYFYKNKSALKVTVVLRNANFDPVADAAGGTFGTAFKGFQAYELRIAPNLSGTLNYTIATDAAPQTGTLSGSDSAFIYQGQTSYMSANTVDGNYCDPGTRCANMYTPDVGYVLKKNGSSLASGGQNAAAVGGWADVSDASGAGLEIGIYQMSAYWPASLEFNSGGTDARIGIFSGQNSKSVYMIWPYWSVHEVFLNFHGTALPSPSNDFLKFQHFLVARAAYTYYNGAGVFPYPIIDPASEDNYYIATGQAANPAMDSKYFCYDSGIDGACTPDRGTTNTHNEIGAGIGLGVVREYPWSSGGSLNQAEMRWGDLMRFLQRGQTGRFLNSKHFYQYLSNFYVPHSDGTSATDSSVNNFNWRSQAYNKFEVAWGQPGPLFAAALNTGLEFGDSASLSAQGRDYLHDHWYGMPDYYFLTGDETMKEGIVPFKDWALNQTIPYWGNGSNTMSVTRAYGVQLISTARLGTYLAAVHDPDATNVLAIGQHAFDTYVADQGCEGGLVNGVQKWYPTGCTAPSLNATLSTDPIGISLERGNHQAGRMAAMCPHPYQDGTNTSGMTGYYRISQAFMQGILIQGILEFRNVMGSGWSEYQKALDYAFGFSQGSMTELFVDDGQNHWDGGATKLNNNGFSYARAQDFPDQCPAQTSQSDTRLDGPYAGKMYDDVGVAQGCNTVFFNFYAQALVNGVTPDFERKFQIAMQQAAIGTSVWPGDFGMYGISNIIAAISDPSATALVNVPITTFHDSGSGSYTLGWTPPAGAQSYVVRWGQKAVVDSLQFDSLYTNSFGLSPDTNQNWWTSNLVTNNLSGAQSSIAVTADKTGYLVANFSVKARVPSSSLPHTNPPLLSNGAPTSPPPLPSGTSQATLSLNTNVSATCKYSTTPGVAYGAMTNSFTADSNGTTQTAPVTGLSDGNGYPYYVRCQDTQGNTNPADYLIYFQVGPGQVAPPAPGSVVVTPGNRQVTVGWTPVSNATSYNIYWVAGISDPKTGTVQVSNNSPTVITGLTNGTLYTFAVTAVNSVGESIESAKVTATPSTTGTPPTGGNPPQGPVTPGQTLSVRVYPNPWRGDKHGLHPSITFDGFIGNTTIKLFTVSGHKVRELTTNQSKIDWDLMNDSGDKVASGVYLYVITDNQGDKVKGKVAVIK